MCTNMPFKIYTEKQVHVSSVPRHCVPSEISTAIGDGTETRSKETSTYSWSLVSNYQLSHIGFGVWAAVLRGGRRVCYIVLFISLYFYDVANSIGFDWGGVFSSPVFTLKKKRFCFECFKVFETSVKLLHNSPYCTSRGHRGRVVTLSPPTSEIGVRFPARPQVGKLVVGYRWSAVYSTEPWPTVCTGFLCPSNYLSWYDLYNVLKATLKSK